MRKIALFPFDINESAVAAFIVKALQGGVQMGVYVQCLLRLAIATHPVRLEG